MARISARSPASVDVARPSGVFRGLLVGIAGVALWLTASTGGLGPQVWRLLWTDAAAMTNMELEAAFAFVFGPIVGLAFSLALSSFVERVVRNRRVATDVHAAAVATGLYALVLGVLFTASRRYAVDFPPLTSVRSALFFTGLTLVGPIPLVLWALLAGLLHGLWRPRPK